MVPRPCSGKPMTETVQRCRKYAPVGDSAKGSGGAYTGGHVGRACIEPLGPPLQATKWTFATNNSGALDSHNIKTVCDHGDSSQCELWLGAYTFYTAYVGLLPAAALSSQSLNLSISQSLNLSISHPPPVEHSCPRVDRMAHGSGFCSAAGERQASPDPVQVHRP